MSDVKVLATTAMKTVFEALGAPFRSATGHGIAASFGPSVQVEKRLAEGEAADVAILTNATAADMLGQGKLLAGSLVEVATSALGVAVQKGAPRPDISTADAFKAALLAAKSVAVSKPVGAGLSGVHMAKIFQDLGISDAMAAKARYGTGGVSGLVGLIVKRGEAEIGVQQIAELMAVPDIDFVGPLPPALQAVTPFTAAIVAGSSEVEAARALIGFLRTPAAARIIREKGLEPAS